MALSQTGATVSALMTGSGVWMYPMVSEPLLSRLQALFPVLEGAAVRLRDPLDDGALHELRVAVRKARTLLRPFRTDAAVADLLEGMRSLARQTGQPRDDEVLLGELVRLGLPRLAARRRPAVRRARQALADSPALPAIVAQWPVVMAALTDDVTSPGLQHAGLRQARRRVTDLLAAPATDLHELRLAIKRLRYRLQADPDAPPHLLALLRQLQTLLGRWHDRDVWLQRAAVEADLQPCVSCWRREMAVLERQLEPLCDGLRRALA